MAEKDFNVRGEIMAMIAKTTDDNMRMVWVIMHGLLEQSAAGISAISDKIDRLLDDEESLRKSVLNGHEPTHHSDHDWVQERRRMDCAKVCEWSRKKMVEEQQDADDAKEITKAGKKAAVEAGVRLAVTAGLSALAGVIGAVWVLK